MNNRQACINGFVKRASEYGLNQNEAIELYKQSFLGNPAYNKPEQIDEEEAKRMNFSDMARYTEPTEGEGMFAHLKRHPGAYAGLALGSLLGIGVAGAADFDGPAKILGGAMPGAFGALAGSVPDAVLNKLRRIQRKGEAEAHLNSLHRHIDMQRRLNSDARVNYNM
jgi:hypothetical protein